MLLQSFIILLALVAAFACLEAHSDSNVIETAPGHFDRKEFHLLNFLTRAFVVAVAVWLHFGPTWLGLAALIYAGIAFWIFFEVVICCKLFDNPFAVGTTAATDKKIRAFAKLLNLTPEVAKLLLMGTLSFTNSFILLSL